MSKTAVIIPARYGSSRLEGKPLIEVLGKPIIQWVYEKAQQTKLADIIIVATDDERIYDAVKSFGGNVEMTSPEHKCGSDRIKEVVMRHPEISYIVNLQGDEPLIKPESIDEVIKNVKEKELQKLDIYKKGGIYLQSLSSMIPPIVLNPKQNEKILDLTAAPRK